MNPAYKTISAIVLALLLAAGASASHFPYNVGARWEFSYTNNSGGWGISIRDSGTIEWEIIDVQILESYPVQQRIRIVQTRSLHRTSRTPGFIPDDTLAYDSILDPPRVTLDTLVLRGTDGINGLWFEGDTCWSFVLDPDGDVPADKVLLADTTVSYRGSRTAAVTVDPSPCRGGSGGLVMSCAEPQVFITADNIGPVGYFGQSSPCLMDYYFAERWSLVSYRSGMDGGECTYSDYAGTATIVGIETTNWSDNAFDVLFTFATDEQVAESWYTYDPDEVHDLSEVFNAPQLMDQLFVKVGHSYPCTLSVITHGTCTPSIFTIGLPDGRVNQSNPWIEPDTVAANEAFDLTLLSSYFTCNTIFTDLMGTASADEGVILYYSAEENPLAGICAPSANLFGITYTLDGLPAGEYPVYRVEYPQCYPLCDVAIVPQLVDTLVVTSGTAVTTRNDANATVEHRVWQSGGSLFVCLAGVERSAVVVELLDLTGRRVSAAARAAGNDHAVRLAGPVPAGLYVLRIREESGAVHSRAITAAKSSVNTEHQGGGR